MRVDIGCSAEIAVSKPFLDLLQWHMVSQQKTGAAMAQIVESYLTQAVFFKDLLKIGSSRKPGGNLICLAEILLRMSAHNS